MIYKYSLVLFLKMAAPVKKNSSFEIVNVDLKDNENSDQMELEFQDFSMDSADKITPAGYSENNLDATEESAKLLIEPEEEKRKPSFWEFAYYQTFFDVNTDQVLNRALWSVIPRPSRATYIHQCIRPNPDLYGPFWICATLVFTIAVSGNMANYLQTQGKQKEIWHYDFHKVSLAATTIYTYTFLIPLGLWGVLWYRKSSANYTLLEIVCSYGYSLAIYLPVSVFCAVPIQWLQWTFITTGFVMSAVVLLLTYYPAVKDDTKKVAFGVLLTILVLHMLLAISFMAYFFMPSSSSSTMDPTAATTTIHVSAPLKHAERKVLDQLQMNTSTVLSLVVNSSVLDDHSSSMNSSSI